jgi:hypothetical protein
MRSYLHFAQQWKLVALGTTIFKVELEKLGCIIVSRKVGRKVRLWVELPMKQRAKR